MALSQHGFSHYLRMTLLRLAPDLHQSRGFPPLLYLAWVGLCHFVMGDAMEKCVFRGISMYFRGDGAFAARAATFK